MTASEYLKKHTAHYHDLAEEKFQSKLIFSGEYGVEQLQKLLLANYQLASAVEIAVKNNAKHPAAPFFVPSKATALGKDLADFHLTVPSSMPTLALSGAVQQWGSVYVLVGASLGGAVMRRQLLKYPAFQHLQFHYFGLHGENLGAYWQDFTATLNAAVEEAQYADALHGAEAAYQLLLSL